MQQWCTQKLFDRFNYESKGENNKRIMSWGMLLNSQHFKGRGQGPVVGPYLHIVVVVTNYPLA
jgi:hypothetical protein